MYYVDITQLQSELWCGYYSLHSSSQKDYMWILHSSNQKYRRYYTALVRCIMWILHSSSQMQCVNTLLLKKSLRLSPVIMYQMINNFAQ